MPPASQACTRAAIAERAVGVPICSPGLCSSVRLHIASADAPWHMLTCNRLPSRHRNAAPSTTAPALLTAATFAGEATPGAAAADGALVEEALAARAPAAGALAPCALAPTRTKLQGSAPMRVDVSSCTRSGPTILNTKSFPDLGITPMTPSLPR